MMPAKAWVHVCLVRMLQLMHAVFRDVDMKVPGLIPAVKRQGRRSCPLGKVFRPFLSLPVSLSFTFTRPLTDGL